MYDFIKQSEFQVFYTTHSKNFIDENNLNSILFLEAEYTSQYYERVKRDVDYITTTCTSVQDKEGYYKICEHLGIEPVSIPEPVLGKYNILVEGECDVNYLTKLADYFGILHNEVKMICASGASLITPMLSVYDTLSLDENDSKPIIHVLFDNDEAGQKEYKAVSEKVKNERYRRIVVQPFLIQNFKGESPKHVNHEIEDLIYPEVFCHVVNIFLKRSKMNCVDTGKVIEYYDTPRFKTKGLLSICDFLMSYANVEKTLSISDKKVKGQLCELFDISNSEIIKLLNKSHTKSDCVEMFVRKLFDFD